MAKIYTLMARPSIIVEEGNEDSLQPAVMVTSSGLDGDVTITAHTGDGEEIEYAATNLDFDPNGAAIDFQVDGVQYFIRNLREEDGLWLSSYGLELPRTALAGLIRGGGQMGTGDETLTAYAMDDSPYVVGLVYTNDAGNWSRVDGDWNLLSDRDNTFDGMISTPISNASGAKFINLFDNNYVSVDDLDAYTDESDNELNETPADEADETLPDGDEPKPDPEADVTPPDDAPVEEQ